MIDRTVTVTEAEIAEAEHWIVEGAAGAAMATLIKTAAAYKGGQAAVALCGRNTAFETFLAAVAAHRDHHPNGVSLRG